jgi:hypothetical protein
MTSTTTKPDSLQPAAEMAVDLFDNWFDPIGARNAADAPISAVDDATS